MNQSVMLNIPEKTSNLLNSDKDTDVVLMLGWKLFLFPVFVQAKILSSKPKASLLEQANQEVSEFKEVINSLEKDNKKINDERLSREAVLDEFQEKRKMFHRYEEDSIVLQKLITIVGSISILKNVVDSYISDSHVPDSEKQDALAASDSQNQCQCHNKRTTPVHNQ